MTLSPFLFIIEGEVINQLSKLTLCFCGRKDSQLAHTHVCPACPCETHGHLLGRHTSSVLADTWVPFGVRSACHQTTASLALEESVWVEDDSQSIFLDGARGSVWALPEGEAFIPTYRRAASRGNASIYLIPRLSTNG